MKLSVSTYSLWRWRHEQKKTVAQSVDWIADSGAAAVEFSGLDDGGDNTVKRAATLRKRCEKRGLRISGYCVGAELLVNPKAQSSVIEAVKSQVDVAAELGVRSMRYDVTRGFDAYKNYRGPKTFAAALKIVTPAIRQIADYAQTKGVITTLENHGFYMQASKRVEQLIKTVNHSHYGLTMDMGNFLCVNENPVDAVRRAVKYAVNVHVKDFHVKPKRQMPTVGWFATPTPIALRGAIVGHGAIDIPAQLRILKRAGYKRFLGLEFEGLEEPTKAITWGLEYLREQLKAL